MSEFFQMGGYAAYVWSSYGVSALALGVLTWAVLKRWRTAKQRLASIEKAETRSTPDSASSSTDEHG